MTYETILLERSAPVWLLTLNRPHRLNAMSQTMLDEIAQACNEIEAILPAGGDLEEVTERYAVIIGVKRWPRTGRINSVLKK